MVSNGLSVGGLKKTRSNVRLLYKHLGPRVGKAEMEKKKRISNIMSVIFRYSKIIDI